MTWMTPFDVSTSAPVTVAPFTFTSLPTVKASLSPLMASADALSVRSDDITFPETTWYVRMSTSVAFSSSVSKVVKSIPASANA